jgi:hypothetical protein
MLGKLKSVFQRLVFCCYPLYQACGLALPGSSDLDLVLVGLPENKVKNTQRCMNTFEKLLHKNCPEGVMIQGDLVKIFRAQVPVLKMRCAVRSPEAVAAGSKDP